MSCCGGKRSSPINPANGVSAKRLPPVPVSAAEAYSFQYTGNTALTATGSATGATYHFSYSGAVQMVHRQDAEGLMQVPNLVRIG